MCTGAIHLETGYIKEIRIGFCYQTNKDTVKKIHYLISAADITVGYSIQYNPHATFLGARVKLRRGRALQID